MKYFVSRQRYWPNGDLVVEIANGGLDYANPDMLSAIWYASGEGEEYYDPRAALTAAFQVRSLWKMVEKDQEIRIEVGYTGGYTMPFCDHPTDEELVEWARKEYESLPKCDRCGELLDDPKKAYYIPEFGTESGLYCREYCAEEAYGELMAELEDDMEDEDGR